MEPTEEFNTKHDRICSEAHPVSELKYSHKLYREDRKIPFLILVFLRFMYIPEKIKTKEKNGKRYLSTWERLKWKLRLRISILLHDIICYIPQTDNTKIVQLYERILIGDFELVEHYLEIGGIYGKSYYFG
jgi:hypothetical protein